MPNKPKIVPSQSSGFFPDLVLRIKLILRLMADRRVNLFVKLIPIVALLYLISPIDVIPDIALPVIGYLDDAVVLWLGFSLFVALCPEQVVKEHMNALKNIVPGSWRDAPPEEGERALDHGTKAGDDDQTSN